MKAIVHIGMPKAGSTTIQAWLATNREALSAKGVAYDRAALKDLFFNPAHVEMSICAHDKIGQLIPNNNLRAFYGLHTLEDQKAFARRYRDHFAKVLAKTPGDVFVVSSEFFAVALTTADHIKGLQAWLGEFFDDISYLVYFRRQEEFVPSSFGQRMKRGMKQTLEGTIRTICEKNYHATARLWADCVDEKNLSVRLLERDVLMDGDLISDFCDVLGVDPADFERPDPANTSVSAAAVSILSAFNSLSPAFVDHGRQRNPLGKKFTKAVGTVDQKMDFDTVTLTKAQHDKVRELCASNNEKLRADFFPDRKELFPERPLREPIDPTVLAQQIATLSANLIIEMNNGETHAEKHKSGSKKKLILGVLGW